MPDRDVGLRSDLWASTRPPRYFAAAALGMWLLHRVLPLGQVGQPPWNRLGLAVAAVGAAVGLWGVCLFARSGTTVRPLRDSERLVIRGPYRFTRNPMYVGMLLSLAGWWLFLSSISPAVVILLFVLRMDRKVIPAEERMLEARFGEDYRRYRSSVRRWL